MGNRFRSFFVVLCNRQHSLRHSLIAVSPYRRSLPHPSRSLEARLLFTRWIWCLWLKASFQYTTVHPHRFEKRHAFLSNTSPRLPHWRPRSSPGLRPTIPFVDRRYCKLSTCLPSEQHLRLRLIARHYHPSAPSSLGARYQGHRHRARPWRRLHINRCNGRAAMRRSSCQPCRHLLH